MIPELEGTDELEPLRDLDFDFEKASAPPLSPVRSHLIDRKASSVNHSALSDPPVPDFVTQICAPLPLRPHRTFVKQERPSPVISGTELLHLEGRQAVHRRMATALPIQDTASSGGHTLRRKDKFCGTPLNFRPLPQQVDRRPVNETVRGSTAESSHSGLAWAEQHLQQVSLQPSDIETDPSHQARYPDTYRSLHKSGANDLYPRPPYSHRKNWSESSILGGPSLPGMEFSPGFVESFSAEVGAQAALARASPDDYDVGDDPTPSISHLRQAPNWNEGFLYDTEYNISSPAHISQDWQNDHSDAFYSSNITYATSTSQSQPTIFSQVDVPGDSTHGSHFHSHEASLDYGNMRASLELIQAPIPRPPQTPPPSDPSVSPGSPPPSMTPRTPTQQQTTSPTKTPRNRRKNGVLRPPKSTAALRPTKSNGTLKLAKSTGNLKSRKSAGNLGGGSIGSGVTNQTNSRSPIKKEPCHHRQHYQRLPTHSLDYGFMNYTPSDKDKILTGVAPSGSSKTKQRREKEASDERRRMSLAAKKEIERLGGDMPLELLALEEEVELELEA